MAEKSPLAHALEKNTKALQAVHKSRGQAGGAGAGAVSDSYDSPLSLGQAAGLQFQKRKQHRWKKHIMMMILNQHLIF